MGDWEDYFYIMKSMSLAWLPNSKAEKEEFLGKVREKVDFYKPRIEDKCEVELGEVSILDFNEYKKKLPEKFYDVYEKTIKEEDGEITPIKDYIAKSVGRVLVPPLYNFLVSGSNLAISKDKMIVPFNLGDRAHDRDYVFRERKLDQDVVYHLSGMLWNELEGDNHIKGSEGWREFLWGYLTYCELQYFSDIYPEDHTIRYRPNSKKVKYMENIEAIVEKHGQEIVLEIPKHWEDFIV